MLLPKEQSGMSHMLRMKRVVLDVSVVGNATAANVKHSSDAPGSVFLQTEGNDDVSSQDSGATFGTIENNNAGASIMGVLLHCPNLLGGKVQKLFSASVSEVTSTAGTVALSLKGASSSGITSDGNLALTISGTTANLAADTVTYRLVIECLLQDRA